MNKTNIKIAVIFLTIIFVNSNSLCKSKNYKSFNRYFTFVDTISFNIDSLLIGDISDILVLGSGKYVIKDPIALSAFWVDTKNKIFKKLSVEKELPGVDNATISLYKDPQTGFWESISQYYLKFNDKGNLLSHYRNNKYFVSDKFCVDSLSNLIIYYKQEKYKYNYLLYYDLKNNDIYRMIKLGFSKNFTNAIRRFRGGGLLIDEDNYLYAANSIEDKIYKYNLSGNLIECFKSKHVPFKSLEKDLLPGTEGIFEYFRKTKGKISITNMKRIGFINDKYIFAEYIGSKGEYIEIFSKHGKVINKKAIKLPKGFDVVGSSGNCIYFKSMLIFDEKPDEIKNPVILKYEFNDRGK